MKMFYLPSEEVTHIKLIRAMHRQRLFRDEWKQLEISWDKNTFLDPASIVFLCGWCMARNAEGRTVKFQRDHRISDFLSRINFFHHLGIQYNESFRRLNEKGRFTTILQVYDDSTTNMASNAICDLLLYSFDNARLLIPALEWAVYEIIDNIRIHAESTIPGLVYARVHHKNLQIAIYDNGRGIYKSLSETIKLDNHGEAILRALQRGVTRNLAIGQGNGLAGSLEISRMNRGDFRIWSGNVDYFAKGGKRGELIVIPTSITGTGVYFSLRTDKPVDLQDTFIGQSTCTHIEAIVQQITSEGSLKITKECVNWGSRWSAQMLRRKILNLLPDLEEDLIIDFAGTESRIPSSSFLDELIGRLADEIGIDELQKRIQLVNMSPLVQNMTNVVIHQRIGQANNR